MSLAPLLDAAPAIPLHAFAAMAAFGLGLVQFAAPKGTLPHRTLGWIWVGLMLAVAISSFWIHQIRLVGLWSPIHLLSISVLFTVPLGGSSYSLLVPSDPGIALPGYYMLFALSSAGVPSVPVSSRKRSISAKCSRSCSWATGPIGTIG